MTTTTDENWALELDSITIAFGANQVLKGVDLKLRPGSVTALLGANGAGKSTLIKVLSGVYSAQGGTVRVDGDEVEIESPSDASKHGIQTVHQRIDDSIVPGLTVAENLVFEEIARGEFPAVSSLRRLMPRARTIASTLDLDWDDSILKQDVFHLGIADCQLLLLARALVHRPKVLVLDEPTSTLSASEAERLFALVEQLRDAGVAILYVSHRLSEIRQLADTVVVLRDGKVVDEQAAPFDLGVAIGAMLGREALEEESALQVQRGEGTALSISGARILDDSALVDMDFRYGEVTAIIGLIGAGKTELAQAVFGANRLEAGTFTLDGKPFAPRHPSTAVDAGVFLVPEDRAHEAMFPGWSITRTLTVPFLSRFARLGVMAGGAERAASATAIEDFGVVATGPNQPVDALSGGNQQKVVVARWMAAGPRVLILDEPFRGVDIGARTELSLKARSQAADGACVVVMLSDVDELRQVADRVIVLVEGEVRLDAYADEIDDDQIITSMSEVA